MRRLLPVLLCLCAACSYPGKVEIIHRVEYDIVTVTAYDPEQFADYFDTLRIDRSKIPFVIPDMDDGKITCYSIFLAK